VNGVLKLPLELVKCSDPIPSTELVKCTDPIQSTELVKSTEMFTEEVKSAELTD
jgi:hypothetical protein